VISWLVILFQNQTTKKHEEKLSYTKTHETLVTQVSECRSKGFILNSRRYSPGRSLGVKGIAPHDASISNLPQQVAEAAVIGEYLRATLLNEY
jgi:hypothetical protein